MFLKFAAPSRDMVLVVAGPSQLHSMVRPKVDIMPLIIMATLGLER